MGNNLAGYASHSHGRFRSLTLLAMRPEPVLSAAAMRRADERAIRDFGIPAHTLMESAGKGAAQRLLQDIRPERANGAWRVYCGKGHNGGDGFVLARYLYEAGANVEALHLHRSDDDLSGDVAAHFATLCKLAETDLDDRLRVFPYEPADPWPHAAVHVDALLGTGLERMLRQPVRTLVERLNAAPGFKMAIDIPTGLHADLGKPLGAAFRADLTCAMAARKTGLCLREGPAYAGLCAVIDIGVPYAALRDAADADPVGSGFRASDSLVRAWMPTRNAAAHKYSAGLALIVAGSEKMTGAAAMAAEGAARAGAGYVACGCDHRIRDSLEIQLPDVATIPLPAGSDGIAVEGALKALSERLAQCRALTAGCGLGRAADTQAFVLRLLETAKIPVVVDADALHALIGRTDFLKNHARGRWILTPHEGEFLRLFGSALDKAGIPSGDRMASSRYVADAFDCVLVRKGYPALATAPGGRIWINATGGPALATAGTGDVLAGLCGGLLAQGLSAEQAAVAGLLLGGAAADRYSSKRSGRSLRATDLLDELPFALRERLDLE